MRKMTEITQVGPLLNSEGNLSTPGFARKYLLQYDRNDIKARPIRIKEWDYYYIGNQDWGLMLTISDVGFLGVVSATLLDFKVPYQVNRSKIRLFPMGKFNMPSNPEIGNISQNAQGATLTFNNDGKERHIFGKYPKFFRGQDLIVDIKLKEPPEEYMFIATPFEKPAHFYYNAKINCLKAEGYFEIGDKVYNCDDALGTLDWGRGVWTYDNTWYWGSFQNVLNNGKTFGFNIGYGFGDTSAATENMLFYDGKSHKLEDVSFNIPGEKEGKPRYMDDWTFTSSDGRLELDFKPVIDRNLKLSVGFMAMIPHQVFGLFSGKCILDDGTEIIIKDKMGFAEKVRNKW